ncbi:MAG: hypothetical protein Q8O34_05640 [Rhodocyclaceae bacterium]|nr:hypothetical protein [Rhodocyclaceae bacterium]
MKSVRSLLAGFAAAWLTAGAALAQSDGREPPLHPELSADRPARGHARSLRQELMQTAPSPADMPAHMRMTPEERRKLRRDIHEADREIIRSERRRHRW